MSPRFLPADVRRRVGLAATVALVTSATLVAGGTSAQAGVVALCSDSTGPQLTALAHTKAVNVVTRNKKVVVTAHATDDISGVASVLASFTSPKVKGVTRSVTVSLRRTTGSGLSGDWKGSGVVRRWTNNGTWHLTNLFLQDRVGNATFLSESQLKGSGFSTTLKVTSHPDTIRPTATALSFKPRSVNTVGGKKTVKVSATLKDKGGSGVSAGFLLFGRSAAHGSYGTYVALNHKRGTKAYVGTATVPKFADAISPAKWKLSMSVYDNAGNSTSYTAKAAAKKHWPTTLKVVTKPDKAPPKLAALSVAPGSVDVSAAAGKANVTAKAKDNLSGTTYVSVQLARTGGFEVLFGSLRRTSGTARNGVWKGTVTIPLCQTAGSYVFSQVTLGDATGNTAQYNQAQLTGAGFTDSVNVTS